MECHKFKWLRKVVNSFGELADIHFGMIQSIFRTEETVRIDIVFDRYDVK